MAKELWKGNEAFAEAAVRAGLQAYFGYPITPQTEAFGILIRPYAGTRAVCFLQAESELGAHQTMVYGARLHRCAHNDIHLQPGHQPDDGRLVLHRRH